MTTLHVTSVAFNIIHHRLPFTHGLIAESARRTNLIPVGYLGARILDSGAQPPTHRENWSVKQNPRRVMPQVSMKKMPPSQVQGFHRNLNKIAAFPVFPAFARYRVNMATRKGRCKSPEIMRTDGGINDNGKDVRCYSEMASDLRDSFDLGYY